MKDTLFLEFRDAAEMRHPVFKLYSFDPTIPESSKKSLCLQILKNQERSRYYQFESQNRDIAFFSICSVLPRISF